MNILFITRRFPPSVGGMERYAFDLYSALARQSDLKIRLIKWSGHNKWLHVALLPYFFIAGFWMLLTQKVDIIHMQDGVLAPIGWVLHLIFRKPYVVVIHGLDITYSNPLFKVAVPFAVRRASKVICISSAAREEVLKRNVKPEKAVVVTLGIDDVLYMSNKQAARQSIMQELNIPNSSKILLSVGRLVRRKGIAWFIQNVMPGIVAKNPQAILLVAGKGDDRENIEAAIKKVSLEHSVRLLGRTTDEMRRNLFNGSDVFIMPNISVAGDMEGFGLVLTEAASCELPVVAAGIEGIRDAVKDGENGYLVSSKDSAAFEVKILDILAHPDAAEDFGKKARLYTLKNYNWPAIAGQVNHIYADITR
jgi:phosphatidyl-myo-inositol dimannoside synthase